MQPRPAPGGRVLVDGIALDVGEPGEGIELPEPDEALYVLQLAADGTTRLVRAGSGWGPVLGTEVGDDPDLLAEAWAAAVHASDAGGFLAARERLRGGEPTDVAYRLVGLDGRERVVLDRATPWPGPDGSVLAAGIVVDVTGERRARTELEETQRRLETVLAAVAEVVFTEQLLDDGGRHAVFVGPGLEGLLGGGVAREALPETWDAAVHPDDRAAWSRHLAAIERGEPADLEHRLLGLDGVERWVALRSRPRRDPAGRRLVDGIATDVTARRQAADVVAERERRLRSLVEAIDDVVLTVELEPPDRLRPVLVGHGLERLLGGPVPARSDPVEIWRAALHPEDRPAFAAALRSLRKLAAIDHVHRVVGLDGVVRSVEWRARPRAGEDGRVLIEGMLSDVSEERRALHAIERAHADAEERSRVDALTGLGNRLRLEEELAGARGAVAVLGLDVDHFKRVNDTYGHAVGDEVLVEVAQRLRGAVRATDVVARPGGEEFTVLVPHLPDDAALLRIGDAPPPRGRRPPLPDDRRPAGHHGLDRRRPPRRRRGHARGDAARRRRRGPLRREAPRPQPRRPDQRPDGRRPRGRGAHPAAPGARAGPGGGRAPGRGRSNGSDRGRRGGGAGPGPGRRRRGARSGVARVRRRRRGPRGARAGGRRAGAGALAQGRAGGRPDRAGPGPPTAGQLAAAAVLRGPKERGKPHGAPAVGGRHSALQERRRRRPTAPFENADGGRQQRPSRTPTAAANSALQERRRRPPTSAPVMKL